jgi:LmbE family N-acetylglucosaminyl deacetylase
MMAPRLTQIAKRIRRIRRVYFKKWSQRPQVRHVRKLSRKKRVQRIYLAGAFSVLCLTTIYWALLGAILHGYNADQIANAYLLESADVFRTAAWPDQHSFLLKWPLFLVVAWFVVNPVVVIITTVLVCLVTVIAFAALLRTIEKRPVPLGTLYVLLASCLMLIPAQPYAGGLLPVNMAMLTTRNIEYVIYLAALLLSVRADRFRSWKLGAAVTLLAVLIASDKLFMSVSLATGLGALIVYAAREQWDYVRHAVRWFVCSTAATIVALVILAIINVSQLTNIAAPTVVGPYGLNTEPRSLAIAGVYAVTGFLTNLGANPASAAVTIGALPGEYIGQLIGPGLVGFSINTFLAFAGLVLALRLLLGSVMSKQHQDVSYNRIFTVLLLWSAGACVGLFVASKHYYPVDARYMALVLFSLFTVFAQWSSVRKKLLLDVHLVIAACCVIGIVGSGIFAWQAHQTQLQATKGLQARNVSVATLLQERGIRTLVGDYWRVLPVKQASNNVQTVVPLASCTQLRDVLTSAAWQRNLSDRPFAYLLTISGSATDFPDCTMAQVAQKFGIPDSATVIAGSISKPDELLLFYERGLKEAQPQAARTSATDVPFLMRDMPTSCVHQTTVSVVAHQDDDLLFMNPDITRAIAAGQCVRTVYITAGDAGSSETYWLSREAGSIAAYKTMLGSTADWIRFSVMTQGGRTLHVAQPADNPSISIIFMRLPDGNITGQGFSDTDYASLAALLDGRTARLTTVDTRTTYTALQLERSLYELLRMYRPDIVRAPDPSAQNDTFPDHSDHLATGLLAERAYKTVAQSHSGRKPLLKQYLGYQSRSLVPNVEGDALLQKQRAFAAYSVFDPTTCTDIVICQHAVTYAEYLDRQYAR